MRGGAIVVVLAGCGRVGFDAAPAIDALDEVACTFADPVALDGLASASEDSEPALSPDGTQIVFSSRRIEDSYRLFHATRTGSEWSAPALIPGIDSEETDLGPAWNAAGDRLYFASFRDGPLHLYVAPFAGGAFGAPALVPGLEGLTESLSPTVRGDELEMFFTSRLPPHRIEYATRSAITEPWTPRGNVTELGDADHGFPGISADGRVLYLETRIDSRLVLTRAARASLASPFGAPEVIATLDAGASDGDPQPSADGSRLVFASDRAEPGNFDLYVAARRCP